MEYALLCALLLLHHHHPPIPITLPKNTLPILEPAQVLCIVTQQPSFVLGKEKRADPATELAISGGVVLSAKVHLKVGQSGKFEWAHIRRIM